MPETKRPTDPLASAMPTKESGNIEPHIPRLDREKIYGTEIDYENSSASTSRPLDSTNKTYISKREK